MPTAPKEAIRNPNKIRNMIMKAFPLDISMVLSIRKTILPAVIPVRVAMRYVPPSTFLTNKKLIKDHRITGTSKAVPLRTMFLFPLG
jgi:hypothetical protein